jgi:leader peptidase (prepilin peptidase)/N-methyltransferase
VDTSLAVTLIVFLFAFGAVVGSFLNVCIYRLPEGQSLIRPGSHCPQCKHPIRWHDNIPIVSYVLLKARCRDCGARISPRYLIVEALTATLFMLLVLTFLSRGEPVSCIAIYLALACVLIVASFIDLDHTIIPDELTIPGMILAPILSLAFPAMHDPGRHAEIILSNAHLNSLVHSIIGIGVGAGFIFLTRVLGGLVFRKEAMGLGDVKFMGMIGGFFGWKQVMLANLIAPIYGSLIGLALLLSKGEHKIPYGPFLSLGAVTVMIWGPDVLSWIGL